MVEANTSLLSKKEELEIKNEEVFESQNLTDQKNEIDEIFKEEAEFFASQENLIVSDNYKKVEYIDNIDLKTDEVKEQKAAIKTAYKETGKTGSPDKLNDRQKKMSVKLEQQKKLSEYVPAPKMEGPAWQRRMLANKDHQFIRKLTDKLKNALDELKFGSNEEIAENYSKIMETMDKVESLKDSLWAAERGNKPISEELNNDVRQVLATAGVIKDHVDAQAKVMGNKYYALLAQKDTAKLSDKELNAKAEQYKESNPELSRYYSALAEAKSKCLSKKDVLQAREEANKRIDNNKDGWNALRYDGVEEWAKKIKEDQERAEQEELKKSLETAKKKRLEKKKIRERDLADSDELYKEYPLLDSSEMMKISQNHVYNQPGTKESGELYCKFFQFGKDNSKVYGNVDNTYFMSNNGFFINAYLRDRKKGLEKKRENLLTHHFSKMKEYEEASSQDQEKMMQQALDEWEEKAKGLIKRLKDGCKADKIPHNTMLFRMAEEGMLDALGVNAGSQKEIVDNINKKKGTTFKETAFASMGYRVDNMNCFKKLPVMFTILCEKGKKCFVSANIKETEVLFDKPEYEILRAEVCDGKKIPLSDTHMMLPKEGIDAIDYSNEEVGTYKGINIIVKLKTSESEDK